MAIILGITFSGGPQSVRRLALSDTTFQAEIMVREAQLQGSAINSLNDKYGGTGVFFSRALPKQFLKFRDIVDTSVQRAIPVGNGLYDSAPEDEKEFIYATTRNIKIGKLCVATSTSPLLCDNAVVPPIDTLTVSFNRPKQTANIYINSTTTTNYTFACIQIDAPEAPLLGYVKSILVYRSGMITKISGVCTLP